MNVYEDFLETRKKVSIEVLEEYSLPKIVGMELGDVIGEYSKIKYNFESIQKEYDSYLNRNKNPDVLQKEIYWKELKNLRGKLLSLSYAPALDANKTLQLDILSLEKEVCNFLSKSK